MLNLCKTALFFGNFYKKHYIFIPLYKNGRLYFNRQHKFLNINKFIC